MTLEDSLFTTMAVAQAVVDSPDELGDEDLGRVAEASGIQGQESNSFQAVSKPSEWTSEGWPLSDAVVAADTLIFEALQSDSSLRRSTAGTLLRRLFKVYPQVQDYVVSTHVAEMVDVATRRPIVQTEAPHIPALHLLTCLAAVPAVSEKIARGQGLVKALNLVCWEQFLAASLIQLGWRRYLHRKFPERLPVVEGVRRRELLKLSLYAGGLADRWAWLRRSHNEGVLEGVSVQYLLSFITGLLQASRPKDPDEDGAPDDGDEEQGDNGLVSSRSQQSWERLLRGVEGSGALSCIPQFVTHRHRGARFAALRLMLELSLSAEMRMSLIVNGLLPHLCSSLEAPGMSFAEAHQEALARHAPADEPEAPVADDGEGLPRSEEEVAVGPSLQSLSTSVGELDELHGESTTDEPLQPAADDEHELNRALADGAEHAELYLGDRLLALEVYDRFARGPSMSLFERSEAVGAGGSSMMDSISSESAALQAKEREEALEREAEAGVQGPVDVGLCPADTKLHMLHAEEETSALMDGSRFLFSTARMRKRLNFLVLIAREQGEESLGDHARRILRWKATLASLGQLEELLAQENPIEQERIRRAETAKARARIQVETLRQRGEKVPPDLLSQSMSYISIPDSVHPNAPQLRRPPLVDPDLVALSAPPSSRQGLPRNMTSLLQMGMEESLHGEASVPSSHISPAWKGSRPVETSGEAIPSSPLARPSSAPRSFAMFGGFRARYTPAVRSSECPFVPDPAAYWESVFSDGVMRRLARLLCARDGSTRLGAMMVLSTMLETLQGSITMDGSLRESWAVLVGSMIARRSATAASLAAALASADAILGMSSFRLLHSLSHASMNARKTLVRGGIIRMLLNGSAQVPASSPGHALCVAALLLFVDPEVPPPGGYSENLHEDLDSVEIVQIVKRRLLSVLAADTASSAASIIAISRLGAIQQVTRFLCGGVDVDGVIARRLAGESTATAAADAENVDDNEQSEKEDMFDRVEGLYIAAIVCEKLSDDDESHKALADARVLAHLFGVLKEAHEAREWILSADHEADDEDEEDAARPEALLQLSAQAACRTLYAFMTSKTLGTDTKKAISRAAVEFDAVETLCSTASPEVLRQAMDRETGARERARVLVEEAELVLEMAKEALSGGAGLAETRELIAKREATKAEATRAIQSLLQAQRQRTETERAVEAAVLLLGGLVPQFPLVEADLDLRRGAPGSDVTTSAAVVEGGTMDATRVRADAGGRFALGAAESAEGLAEAEEVVRGIVRALRELAAHTRSSRLRTAALLSLCRCCAAPRLTSIVVSAGVVDLVLGFFPGLKGRNALYAAATAKMQKERGRAKGSRSDAAGSVQHSITQVLLAEGADEQAFYREVLAQSEKRIEDPVTKRLAAESLAREEGAVVVSPTELEGDAHWAITHSAALDTAVITDSTVPPQPLHEPPEHATGGDTLAQVSRAGTATTMPQDALSQSSGFQQFSTVDQQRALLRPLTLVVARYCASEWVAVLEPELLPAERVDLAASLGAHDPLKEPPTRPTGDVSALPITLWSLCAALCQVPRARRALARAGVLQAAAVRFCTNTGFAVPDERIRTEIALLATRIMGEHVPDWGSSIDFVTDIVRRDVPPCDVASLGRRGIPVSEARVALAQAFRNPELETYYRVGAGEPSFIASRPTTAQTSPQQLGSAPPTAPSEAQILKGERSLLQQMGALLCPWTPDIAIPLPTPARAGDGRRRRLGLGCPALEDAYLVHVGHSAAPPPSDRPHRECNPLVAGCVRLLAFGRTQRARTCGALALASMAQDGMTLAPLLVAEGAVVALASVLVNKDAPPLLLHAALRALAALLRADSGGAGGKEVVGRVGRTVAFLGAVKFLRALAAPPKGEEARPMGGFTLAERAQLCIELMGSDTVAMGLGRTLDGASATSARVQQLWHPPHSRALSLQSQGLIGSIDAFSALQPLDQSISAPSPEEEEDEAPVGGEVPPRRKMLPAPSPLRPRGSDSLHTREGGMLASAASLPPRSAASSQLPPPFRRPRVPPPSGSQPGELEDPRLPHDTLSLLQSARHQASAASAMADSFLRGASAPNSEMPLTSEVETAERPARTAITHTVSGGLGGDGVALPAISHARRPPSATRRQQARSQAANAAALQAQWTSGLLDPLFSSKGKRRSARPK
jgi:hypothetical protein